MMTAIEMREQLRRCAEIWRQPAGHRQAEVLRALATLISAYALGSRTATAALRDPGPDHPAWEPPPVEEALDVAADLFRSAECLGRAAPPGPGPDLKPVT